MTAAGVAMAVPKGAGAYGEFAGHPDANGVLHDTTLCIGCRLCEKACVTEKASIFVLPVNIAMGESGPHYIRGWDERDEERLKDITGEISTETPRSSREPIDYLNQDDF